MNQSSVEWPRSLPSNKAQPWETQDGAGRIVSSINLQDQFVPGVERFLEAGSVSDFGEASRMASGATWGTPLIVDSAGVVGWYSCLISINATAAIAYTDGTNWDMKYAYIF